MNIYDAIPDNLPEEHIESMLTHGSVRIKRIVSKGHTSPAEGWYDQDDNEWVLVVEGAGTVRFEDGTETTLAKGDYVHIPAHTRHKVVWTDPDRVTVWLAVHY